MPASDNYSILDYGRMINDERRTAPYVEALRRAVKPGSVVLDIGTGTGFFAFLACRFGAARVYAVEPDDAIEVAKLCVKNNIGSERIHWLQGLSTDLDLPERVDVIIGDLHGNLPFYNANIDSLIDARRRHLKPGGTMIPAREVMRVVPTQAFNEYEGVLYPWNENRYGIDLAAGRSFVTNSWWRAQGSAVPPENLLASRAEWGVIDYRTAESASLEGALHWTVERAGTLHGFYVWFDTEFDDGLALTNTPILKEIVYGRSFFPLQLPTEVTPGDLVETRMLANAVNSEHIYRWDTRITTATGQLKGEYKQSTFKSRPIKLDDIKRAAADHVPTLNTAGSIELAALEAMSQGRPLGEIANELVSRFPHCFANNSAALNHVAKLSARFAGADRLEAPKTLTE